MQNSSPALFLTLAMWVLTASHAGAEEKEDTYPVHDFGELAQGVVVEHDFELKNQGDDRVEVARVSFTLAGVTAAIPRYIEPGQVAKLRLKWDTSTYAGPWEGTMTVKFADAGLAPLTFGFSATVRPPIEFSPFPAFYLSQFQGESATRTVELRVNQDRPVDIKAIRSPDDLASLTVEILEPGRHYRLTAEAASSLPVGLHSDFGYLTTDDPDQPQLRVQFNLKVKADLHPSAESVDLARLRPAALRANPEMLEFVTGTVTIESRHGKASQLVASVDLDFLKVIAEAGDEDRRMGVELRPMLEKLKPGNYAGTLTVGFPDAPDGALKLPVTVNVEE